MKLSPTYVKLSLHDVNNGDWGGREVAAVIGWLSSLIIVLPGTAPGKGERSAVGLRG